MSFDIGDVLKDMDGAIRAVLKKEGSDIKEYGDEILQQEKEALDSLAKARLSGEIDEKTFNKEIEREKKVFEAQLLTIEIMTKALAQKAINAAIEVFVKAVTAAI